MTVASVRSPTIDQTPKKSSSSFGIINKLSAILLVALASWTTYQAIQPPPPKICGSPNGPPITASRIKLRDGRHLAYLETGVPKENANHKIIFVHGFYSCRYDHLPISPQVLEELGIYLVSFDRAGYGESDPDTKKTEKSTPLDIEELADQLQLGSKFYVIGFSMGGEVVWGCLKYIPHRLKGAALLGPVSNFWWPNFPANVSKAAWNQQTLHDKLAVGVAHYVPWLTYWWNTKKWFSSSGVIAMRPELFSPGDLKVMHKFSARGHYMGQILQQGEYHSLHRDMMVGFGNWKFDPLELDDPFPNGDGSVHLWHGAEDRIVPVLSSQYIGQKLPWVHYHELPESGHMFLLEDGMPDEIVKSLLLGDQKQQQQQ
ncbi:uncharacterized protein A4U43_C02F8210 [Asparagus officinalis]|uniref:AB hydrolase-1 domain-containing protein n=1 Tax=Asparagus officinalis TaxID=4686 RepID=A0A5P1FLX6_ASPOF|nr:uncharacterized protein LOC109830419 [Asparagus officinalis]ONK77590.1 uncharacterized protein A4U43_C02F8210 [Asparagus officinalis]